MFRTLWLRSFSRKGRLARSRPAQPGGYPSFRPSIESLENRVLLATHWVLNTANAGPLSLRQAILDSNSDLGPTRFIKFSIGSGPCQTISPLSALPAITKPVTIDGTTQPGSGGLPAIQLDGSVAGAANGLLIQASTTLVKGLVINSFRGDGILISLAGTVLTNDVVTDNYIGTDCTGTTAVSSSGAPLGNGNGVVLTPAVTNSLIGRIVGGAKNVISGNAQQGVVLGPGQVTGNRVEGNYIGTDVTGTTAFDSLGNPLGNVSAGVLLLAGANGNTIGGGVPPSGVCDGACNLVSGNLGDGISLFGTTAGAVTGNMVRGNYVGTDVTGTTAFDAVGNRLGNGRHGVLLYAQTSKNTIADNLLSGNGADGFIIGGTPNQFGTGNLVQGNFIGTDRTGTTVVDANFLPLGNGRHGVSLHDGASLNTIGGIGFGAGNVISGNAQDGVNFDDEGVAPETNNLVAGNYIGTDVTGTRTSDPSGSVSLGNGFISGSGNGIDLAFTVFGAINNTIGGTDFGAGNVISGNLNDGVLIAGGPNSRTTGNIIGGNYIGTDVTGTLAVDANGFPFGNGNNGVEIVGAFGNLVGATISSSGAPIGAPNVIANNGIYFGGYGVVVNGAIATGNGIRQNSIFLNSPPPPPKGILLLAGGNASQPAPVLTSANYIPSTGPLIVMGTVAAAPGSTLEFFANNTPPATDCEGQLYLGSATAAAAFTATLPGVIPPGFNWVSATVTTPAPGFGNTSPFSNCFVIAPPPPGAGGSPSGRISPRPVGSLVPVGTALSAGAMTVGPSMPRGSAEPGNVLAGRDGSLANPLMRRDLADVVFGSLDRMSLPENLEGEGLVAGLLSQPAPPVDAGWDLLANGELSLFGS